MGAGQIRAADYARAAAPVNEVKEPERATESENERPAPERTKAGEQAAPENTRLDPITVAHQRGVLAKQQGHTRRAVPGEYRTPDRQREAEAWAAGWDGAAKPETGATGSDSLI